MNWSFQLYSARNTPIEDTLQIVADAGYTRVEAYRDNFLEPAAFRSALDKHGLQVPSMHINLPPLREDSAGMMQRARDYGSYHVVCPYLDEDIRPADAAGWQTLIAELSDLAKRWRDAGFTFAWHNHDFEFEALDNGAIPMNLIMENAPELQWEIDVAWIVRAGADPAPWITEHASRISAVHLKDLAKPGECVDEGGWADLGYGIVPWTSLTPSLSSTDTDLYILEHDDPSDLRRFATRSIATASSYSEQLVS